MSRTIEEGKIVAYLVRYGECTRCGDCCRHGDFKIPELWEKGKCKNLSDEGCILRDTPEYPLACLLFPTGRETHILKQLGRAKKATFRTVLPRCSFEFQLVYE